jgi:hypothetical protein
MSELSGYQSRLNAMTSGQGRYSHYEAVELQSHYEGRRAAEARALRGLLALQQAVAAWSAGLPPVWYCESFSLALA